MYLFVIVLDTFILGAILFKSYNSTIQIYTLKLRLIYICLLPLRSGYQLLVDIRRMECNQIIVTIQQELDKGYTHLSNPKIIVSKNHRKDILEEHSERKQSLWPNYTLRYSPCNNSQKVLPILVLSIHINYIHVYDYRIYI